MGGNQGILWLCGTAMWGRESSGKELNNIMEEEKEKKLAEKGRELRLEWKARKTTCEWHPMYKRSSNSRKVGKKSKRTGRTSDGTRPHKW